MIIQDMYNEEDCAALTHIVQQLVEPPPEPTPAARGQPRTAPAVDSKGKTLHDKGAVPFRVFLKVRGGARWCGRTRARTHSRTHARVRVCV